MHKNLETVKNYFANCVDGKDRDDESERRQPFREPLRAARPDRRHFSAMNSRRS
jgi:hypothetical protein